MKIAAIDIDAQKTFSPLCPNELPVVEGDLIVNELNAQAKLAHFRIMSKDAHTASAPWIDAKRTLQPTNLKNADVFWPPHGIIDTYGFELLNGLPDLEGYDFCIWKGVDPNLHPYGICFHDLEERLSTGCLEWLTANDVTTIIVGGLTTDFCVKASVLQLLNANKFTVIVNRAACRGTNKQSCVAAWYEMSKHGALIFDNAAKIREFLENN